MNQTWRNWNLIIMDSGLLIRSNLFCTYQRDPRVLVVESNESELRPKDSTPAPWCYNEIFNRGLVDGDLVCYMTDDCYYLPYVFSMFAARSLECPNENAWYGSTDQYYKDGRHEEILAVYVGDEKHSLDCKVDGIQVFHRRDVRVPWDESSTVRLHADGIFLEELGRITTIYPIPVKMGVMYK